MLKPISWLKYRLSHVRKDSWHYQLARELWGYKADGKACSYYWYKLPLAIIVWSLLAMLMGAIAYLSIFFGYVPNYIESKNPESWKWNGGAFYYYRTLPSGKKIPRLLVPWVPASVALVLYLLYYMTAVNQQLALVLLAIALGVFAVSAIIFAVSSNWNSPVIARARRAVVDAWNKACPDLVPEYSRDEAGG